MKKNKLISISDMEKATQKFKDENFVQTYSKDGSGDVKMPPWFKFWSETEFKPLVAKVDKLEAEAKAHGWFKDKK